MSLLKSAFIMKKTDFPEFSIWKNSLYASLISFFFRLKLLIHHRSPLGVEKGGRAAGGGEYILGLPEVNTTTYGLKCHYYYCDIICFSLL